MRNEWFEELASDTLYETEYESIFQHQCATLFPDFVVCSFKHVLTDGYREAKADLALIHRTYREWWIVEVELAHHSLHGHVLPQVRVLSQALCGYAHAEALCKQSRDLEFDRVLSMLKGTQPRVMVVVNAPCPDWKPLLAKYDSILLIFELLRSSSDQYIYRVNGEQPRRLARARSKCRLDPLTPRMLLIGSPGILPIVHGQQISLRLGNGISQWVRIDARDTVWLTPVGNNPLQFDREYLLEILETGECVLRDTWEDD